MPIGNELKCFLKEGVGFFSRDSMNKELKSLLKFKMYKLCLSKKSTSHAFSLFFLDVHCSVLKNSMSLVYLHLEYLHTGPCYAVAWFPNI